MEDGPRELVAGTMVGTRYELVHAIGGGAFGRTFVARDRESGRMVAMKALTRGATRASSRKSCSRARRLCCVPCGITVCPKC